MIFAYVKGKFPIHTFPGNKTLLQVLCWLTMPGRNTPSMCDNDL